MVVVAVLVEAAVVEGAIGQPVNREVCMCL